MPILALKNVSVSYGSSKPAVSGVSLELEKGEILCIVGESGSGKSTLLHAIMALLPPSAMIAGQILLAGEDLLQLTPKERCSKRGKSLAMVFQHAGRYLNPKRKIGTQYTAFLRRHLQLPKTDCELLQQDMLRRVQLEEVDKILASYPFQLSGGMMQRLGIAMAMSLRPPLLLADEPTSALDVINRYHIAQLFRQLANEYQTAMIIVTHDIALARMLSDKLAIMRHGQMIEYGLTKEVFDAPQTAYTRTLIDSVISLEESLLL